MPIIKSAKKRVKQALKRKLSNIRFRRSLHDLEKSFYQSIKDNDAKSAQTQLTAVYSIIDTCAKKNIIPKNRANRMKSRAQVQLSAIVK